MVTFYPAQSAHLALGNQPGGNAAGLHRGTTPARLRRLLTVVLAVVVLTVARRDTGAARPRRRGGVGPRHRGARLTRRGGGPGGAVRRGPRRLAELPVREAQLTGGLDPPPGQRRDLGEPARPAARLPGLGIALAGNLTRVASVRFDASDLMPPVMESAFNNAVPEYLDGPGQLGVILQSLDQVQKTAY
jgi:hypothetical protein